MLNIENVLCSWAWLGEAVEGERQEDDRDSDSPWTIEAIDGEQDDKDEVRIFVRLARVLF